MRGVAKDRYFGYLYGHPLGPTGQKPYAPDTTGPFYFGESRERRRARGKRRSGITTTPFLMRKPARQRRMRGNG